MSKPLMQASPLYCRVLLSLLQFIMPHTLTPLF